MPSVVQRILQYTEFDSGNYGATGCEEQTDKQPEEQVTKPLLCVELCDSVQQDSPASQSSPGGTRTPDQGIMSHFVSPLNLGEYNDFDNTAAPRAADFLAKGDVDPNLAIVISKWPELSVAMQAAIVALVWASMEKRN